MILSCNDISKSFLDVTIFDHISFHINDGEKMALIGVNGVGKSTLCKIIIGEMPADDGTVIIPKEANVAYLSQHEELNSELSIFEEMKLSKSHLIEMESRMRELEELISESAVNGDPMYDSYLKEYDTLSHRFEYLGGFSYKSEIIGTLKGLGFAESDFDRPVSTFSGGQKTRLALGKLLLSSPDLLILDEPTNHLDMNSIQWLEGYLTSYKNALLIISHDRYFLDKTTTHTIEIENCGLIDFEGNYTAFMEKKAVFNENRMKEYLNREREIRHQEEVIDKLKQFNREKSIKRAESREKMLAKMDHLDKPQMFREKINFKFVPNIESGKEVLTLTDISKSFGEKKLFSDINLKIHKGEHIALIGDNGTGKTTMLKCICDMIPLSSGKITYGSRVSIAYYDQEHQTLDPDKTIFDEIHDTFPDMDNTKVRNALAAFLFEGDDCFKKISSLSGGEKGRVCLARLMLSKANFLILDEPTNHLDIDSKEILENALKSYEGTILFVSHDRYFINAVATGIYYLTPNALYGYDGNYDYYIEHKDNPNVSMTSVNKDAIASVDDSSNTKDDYLKQKQERASTQKKEKLIKKLEERIEKIEEELALLDEKLADEEICSDAAALMEIQQSKDALNEELEELMMQWEEAY